ncbi:MAG: AMP-binding protein [Hyphomicrobium sp.]
MPPPFDPLETHTSVFAALVAAAGRHGRSKPIVEDADRQPLTYSRLILVSLVLGDKLRTATRAGEAVGVLLPNAIGHVATLIGLNAFDRAAGILNFTAGPRNLVSAALTGPLPVVVTSRRFIEAAKLDDVVAALAATEVSPGRRIEILYLEDVRRGIGLVDKAKGLVRSILAPWRRRRSQASADRPAVILFTSGTEGAPKGVVLTNANLVANSAQIFAHADGMLTPADIVMNPLPMFHSFGLTAATLMPLLNGMKVVLYPSPLHYKQVPKLIGETRATVLLATDTFLLGYARAAEAAELASVRYAIAGAERVKDATRRLWDKTGAMILEGYGATECAPVIACNTPSAHRVGSVGRILPGIAVRLEKVDGIASGGRLYVKGPNVMAGYMMPAAPGVVVPTADGWHDTGDIVTIEDGFVTITGRAKRFAKIGGEMVSLAAVEALAAGLWPDATHVVVGLPDARKGESLVLVTDKADADRAALSDYAREQGFAELAVPKAILVVSAIPVMGTGKVDLPAVAELARTSRPLL